MSLDERKAAILQAVVQQYIETAQPVGSAVIARRDDVAVSSATVRNELHVLESEGYLVQPHTSAGRVPTEKGYRFFVDGLSAEGPQSSLTAARVTDFFAMAHGELEQMLRDTSLLLSSLTGTAAVVTGEQAEEVTIRSVQLVDLSDELVLVVAVTSDGSVLKRSVEVPAALSGPGALPAELEPGRRLLEERLVGCTLGDLGRWAAPAGAPGAALADVAVAALARAVEDDGARAYVEGTSRIAGSFDTRETVEAVLTVLERQFVVVSLLKELIHGDITVAIGSEVGEARLAECSVVVAPYHSGRGQSGAIAVLGPTRMDYAETVSAVAEVSRRLSRILTEG
jgi:heat-inducible transcriptional repressor